jgi:excinuclease ABC subunit A
VIEHTPELIKCADWIVDLGPEGGDQGGKVVCEGTPEDVARCEASYTGKVLKEKLRL